LTTFTPCFGIQVLGKFPMLLRSVVDLYLPQVLVSFILSHPCHTRSDPFNFPSSIFTKETIQKNQQTFANNTFTHCASTTINNSTNSASRSNSATTSSATTTTTSSLDQSSDTSSISRGTIGGIVAGVTVALLVIGMFVWFLRRRRDKSDYAYNGVYPAIDEASYNVELYSPPSEWFN
jgi:hypothetical protein